MHTALLSNGVKSPINLNLTVNKCLPGTTMSTNPVQLCSQTTICVVHHAAPLTAMCILACKEERRVEWCRVCSRVRDGSNGAGSRCDGASEEGSNGL